MLAVLREVAALAPAAGLGPLERAGVDAAAIAHDVVYDGVPGQDEQRSADWAKAALLAAGVGAHAADRVHALVMATASHEAPAGDAAAAVLLDADLAILASAPSEYAAYVTAVRGEYRHLDDAQWASGRTAVLTSLVARDVLFHTAAGRARWDAAARANLRAEVAGLAGDCAKPAERD
ncbi:MAG: hypothetical protein JWN20_215 [Jatrophihabitantaceae bacterium]|nr:hypothetical protein [Jatrophihabitantaceae bacterium]